MAKKDRQRKRLMLLGGLVVLLAVGAVGAFQLKNMREDSLVQSRRTSGMAAHEAGEHQKAIADLGYVINKRPSDGEAALAFAESRRQVPSTNNRHLSQAGIVARRAATAMPEDLRPRELLMSLFSEMGLLTERLDAAREILDIDPTHRTAKFIEIDSLRRLGRRDEAYTRALAFHESDPTDSIAVRTVIDLMIATNQPPNVPLEFIEKASAEAPDDVRIQLLKARVIAMFGDPQEARKAALAAAAMEQPDADTLAATIQLLDIFGETASVDALLDRQTGNASDDDMATVVATSRAWKDGRFADAQSRIAASTRPLAEATPELLAWTILADERSERAAKALIELKSRVSDAARSWVAAVEARDLVRAGQSTDAAQQARRAIELNPRNEMAMFLLGETERAVGDWRIAVERWRSLQVSEPRWLTLRLDIVSALLAAGQTRDAYNDALATLREWPDRLLVAHTLGKCGVALLENNLADANERTQIISLLRELIAQAPDPTPGRTLMARAQAATGDAAGARATLASILDSDQLPRKDELIPLIETLKRHDIFGVDELVARASQENQDDHAIVLAAAMTAHQNGRTREGKTMFESAISRAANEPQRLFDLKQSYAIFLDRIGDSEALGALVAVAQERRQSPEAQLTLLNSRAAWTDRSAIKAAIAALRDASSAGSTSWLVYEARELLTFEPTEKAAAQIVTSLNNVVRREPNNVHALTYLGEAYAVLNDFAQAAQMLSRAVDQAPANSSLLARLIELHQLAGETDQAATRLRAFSALTGLTDDERRRRAQLHLRQGLYAEAQMDLALLAESGSLLDESLAAQAAARSGDVAGARTRFEALLHRDDRNAEVVVAAADFFARNMGIERGLQVLERLPENISEADRGLIFAAFNRRHGRIAEAERQYLQIAESSGNAQAWVALAQMRSNAGDYNGARSAVTRGLEQHPENNDLKMLQVAFDASSGSESVESLARMIELIDGQNMAREPFERYLAVRRAIAGRENDYNYAADQLRRFVSDYPAFYPGWRDLAELHSVAGRPSEAAAVAVDAAYRMPAEPRAAELAARALALAGRFDEALPMAHEWSARLNDDPYPAQLYIAALLRRMNRNQEALQRLDPWKDRILQEADKLPDVVVTYADLLAQNGRRDDAAVLFEPLIENNPEWAVARLRVASTLISQPAIAREWIDRWAPSIPDTPGAKVSLGQTYYELGTATGDMDLLREAVAVLDPALDGAPQRIVPATLLAGASEQLGDLEAAERYYRIALEEGPDEPVVLNNLAYLLIRTGGSSSEAVELARRAVENAEMQKMPQSLLVNFLDSLGAALMNDQQFEDAARAYGRAADLDRENIGVLIGLADAHLAAGARQMAQDAISRLTILRDRGRITDPDQRERVAQIIERASNPGE